ncbi:RNA polymerase principal sigma factor HrdB [Limihaloglobus sulfuriphilus]|uniref:RNA polymerase principal sigma factor HrdB n=1 Tax=Limihaloglobus sulfuriphilus TaxID=1851148 RepID=A0A1Q2MDS2_9BACT|nr:sigma-70 family RNA polymerase sigma factor [Limihaloglobus sulfuriphilus]AQQ70820.1 RNA polymerase principal sigma factor HrdB [Limihaloglobus sulfuriphilus]
MAKIVNKCIKQLLKDVRFAPKNTKLRQLVSAENFIDTIDKNRSYPFDFVCYKITGFRYHEDEFSEDVLTGSDLYTDLLGFVLSLSSQISIPVKEVSEKVYTVVELAGKFKVARKTIDRWRRQGLVSRTYIYEDSRRRVGVRESDMKKFISRHPEMFRRASKFSRMNDHEKRQIISLAKDMAAEDHQNRKEIIDLIAAKVSRSCETVRYTLEAYEKQNGTESVFSKPFGSIDPETAASIHTAFSSGESVEKLAQEHNRSTSSIYRILNQVKARDIKNHNFSYVYNPDFDNRNKVDSILAAKISFDSDTMPGTVSSEHEMQEYINIINNMPVLNADLEIAAFTKYNCLKYLCSKIQDKISISNPKSSYIAQFEDYLKEAERIQNFIIECNLRIVVNTALRYANKGYSFYDLISEGNLALIRAVEKYDCVYSHRFASFANLYIQKVFAAKLSKEWRRKDKPKGFDLAGIAVSTEMSPLKKLGDDEKKSYNLETVIKNNLTNTESYIIRNHYGITGSLLPFKPKTIKTISEELGIGRDKVKLHELKALQKLRHCLSKEEYELFER